MAAPGLSPKRVPVGRVGRVADAGWPFSPALADS